MARGHDTNAFSIWARRLSVAPFTADCWMFTCPVTISVIKEARYLFNKLTEVSVLFRSSRDLCTKFAISSCSDLGGTGKHTGANFEKRKRGARSLTEGQRT